MQKKIVQQKKPKRVTALSAIPVIITLVILSVLLSSCATQDITVNVSQNTTNTFAEQIHNITINDRSYEIENDRIIEKSHDVDPIMRLGVISDPHGEVEQAEKAAKILKERGVDAILIPGDLARNDPLRYGIPDEYDDTQEIIAVLRAVAAVGVPVFVVPGNHETRTAYTAAMTTISKEYTNIFDMTIYRVFDGDDADVISLPGYQIKEQQGYRFIPDDGYWATPTMIEEISLLREGLDDPVFLLSHGPGKTTGNANKTTGIVGPGTGFDTKQRPGKDVGDAFTTTTMMKNNIQHGISGHIHEAGGLAATFHGTPVPERIWAESFIANFGTLEEWTYLDKSTKAGMAGIITVNWTLAMYETITVE